MKITRLTPLHPQLDAAIGYFHEKWGNADNYVYYSDCIRHSPADGFALPQFYLLTEFGRTLGTVALLTNDLASRQDLTPWLACLYVEEDRRGQGLAAMLLNHALDEAGRRGFERLYLATDLENFYENKGWSYYSDAFNPSGNVFRVYVRETNLPAEEA